jgi:hypothetical protein
MPYIGIDHQADFDLLYGLNGEFSVVINMSNPVLQYSGSAEAYLEFHNLFNNIIRTLGSGYLLQKQDILSSYLYPYRPAAEYLQDQYNQHFAGRKAVNLQTYLTITRAVKKGAFYQYDAKSLNAFKQNIDKVMAILFSAGAKPKILHEKEIRMLLKRILSMNFTDREIVLNNIAVADTALNMGERCLRSISLIDIDTIDLPSEIAANTVLTGNDAIRGFPVDLMSFLIKTPGFQCILYNQLIEIPSQSLTLRKLTLKRKRHSGIPDPANALCVEDIDLLLNDVARDNQLLVNAHFNIMVSAESDQLQGACNFIESELFNLGITPSRNAYNQLELFRTAIPGNGVELKPYDWFLTTGDAALCFLYKESLPRDDPSDFLIRFTDRQGTPVGIDLSDLMMDTGRMTNRSRFCLGP